MYFDETKGIRLRANELKEINRILSVTKEKYQNFSHFSRCAIIKLIKEEKEKNGLLQQKSKGKSRNK